MVVSRIFWLNVYVYVRNIIRTYHYTEMLWYPIRVVRYEDKEHHHHQAIISVQAYVRTYSLVFWIHRRCFREK